MESGLKCTAYHRHYDSGLSQTDAEILAVICAVRSLTQNTSSITAQQSLTL